MDNAEILKAYRNVFGIAGHRTKAQEIVLRDIEHRGKIWSNTWIPNHSMQIDPYRGCIAEGERLFAIRTIQMANTKPSDEIKKPKVTGVDNDNADEEN
jgi:hypothetical protein